MKISRETVKHSLFSEQFSTFVPWAGTRFSASVKNCINTVIAEYTGSLWWICCLFFKMQCRVVNFKPVKSQSVILKYAAFEAANHVYKLKKLMGYLLGHWILDT